MLTFVESRKNSKSEFDITFRGAGFAKDIVIPNCANNETMSEVVSKIFSYALVPPELLNINTQATKVTQAATIQFRMLNNATNLVIRVLVARPEDNSKLEKQFNVTRDLTDQGEFQKAKVFSVKKLTDLCKELCDRLNPFTFTDHRNKLNKIDCPQYVKVFGVVFSTQDKTKIDLFEVYPKAATDLTKFSDYYLANRNYILYRPVLIIASDPISALTVLDLNHMIPYTEPFSSLGQTLSERSFDELGRLILNPSKNHKVQFYTPAMFYMIVQNYIIKRAPKYSTVKATFANSLLAAVLKQVGFIKQTFEFFAYTYYSKLQKQLGSTFNPTHLCNLFGLDDFSDYSDTAINFYKAAFVFAKLVDSDTDALFEGDFLPKQYRKFSKLYKFVNKYCLMSKANNSGSEVYFIEPNKNLLNRKIYCPISGNRVRFLQLQTSAGMHNRAVMFTVYNRSKTPVSNLWFKQDEGFARRYSYAIGLNLVNGVWLKSSLSIYYNEHKCVAITHNFGCIESIGVEELDNTVDLGVFSQTVHGISLNVGVKLAMNSRLSMSLLDDDFLENLLNSVAGIAVATMVLRIGRRSDSNLLITPDGNAYALDYSTRWSLEAQFYDMFLRDNAKDYDTTCWNYDEVFRRFKKLFMLIDYERKKWGRSDGFAARFVNLCKKAHAALTVNALGMINSLQGFFDADLKEPQYIRGKKMIRMSPTQIKELFSQYKSAIMTNVNQYGNKLPKPLPDFGGFDLDFLNNSKYI